MLLTGLFIGPSGGSASPWQSRTGVASRSPTMSTAMSQPSGGRTLSAHHSLRATLRCKTTLTTAPSPIHVVTLGDAGACLVSVDEQAVAASQPPV